MANYIKYNGDPSTADAVEQDLSSLTRAEARMPGTNPPKIEKCSTTDHILGKNKLPAQKRDDY